MRLLGAFALVALAASVVAVGSVAWWLNRPLDLAGDSVELSIEPGSSPREVARAWVDAGVRTSPRLLYEWFRWSGQARRIRAGSYEIEIGVTPRSLLDKMVQGDETLEAVRLIEGWTFRQFREALARAPHLKPFAANRREADKIQAKDAGQRRDGQRLLPIKIMRGRRARAP